MLSREMLREEGSNPSRASNHSSNRRSNRRSMSSRRLISMKVEGFNTSLRNLRSPPFSASGQHVRWCGRVLLACVLGLVVLVSGFVQVANSNQAWNGVREELWDQQIAKARACMSDALQDQVQVAAELTEAYASALPWSELPNNDSAALTILASGAFTLDAAAALTNSTALIVRPSNPLAANRSAIAVSAGGSISLGEGRVCTSRLAPSPLARAGSGCMVAGMSEEGGVEDGNAWARWPPCSANESGGYSGGRDPLRCLLLDPSAADPAVACAIVVGSTSAAPAATSVTALLPCATRCFSSTSQARRSTWRDPGWGGRDLGWDLGWNCVASGCASPLTDSQPRTRLPAVPTSPFPPITISRPHPPRPSPALPSASQAEFLFDASTGSLLGGHSGGGVSATVDNSAWATALLAATATTSLPDALGSIRLPLRFSTQLSNGDQARHRGVE